MSSQVDVSVVVLLEEEALNFREYLRLLTHIFAKRANSFEIIIVSNGFESFLRSQSSAISGNPCLVRAFAFPSPVAQAVCVRAALKELMGDVVLLCGSYQQITSNAFNVMLDALDEETDLVCAWRQQRVDPGLNQLQSRFFNTLVRVVTKTDLHDLSCTTRVVRRSVLDELSLYGNMYRFLPVLAMQKGFRVKEVVTEHYQERGATGFYHLSEYFTRIVDVVTLFFNSRFSKKPLRFFSAVGSVFIVLGFLMFFWVFGQKILYDDPIGNDPYLLIASLSMVAGIQAAGIGLLGEIITFTLSRKKKGYVIEKII